MPVYNHRFISNENSEPNPLGMRVAGPTINIEISIPQSLAEEFIKNNKSIPSPIVGLALIDTGASSSCVDNSAIKGLDIKPIGIIDTMTPAGPKQQYRYPAHFFFPAAKINVDFGSITGADLKGQPIMALIGRDILSNFIFVYNGTLGVYTIGY